MSDIPSLAPVTTLNGEWDAYCRTCWNPVYRLWLAEDIPADNQCHHGCSSAYTCPDALERAQTTAEAIKAITDKGRAAITKGEER